MQSRFVPKIPKRTDLLLNRSCTIVSAKLRESLLQSWLRLLIFQIYWSKSFRAELEGLKSPGTCLKDQWPFSVHRLGLAATKGASALKFVHKVPNSS